MYILIGLGASVIVFSNEQLLLKHLMSIVPEENRYNEFAWHTLSIQNELHIHVSSPNDNKKWYHFTSHKRNHWILRGLTSQNDGRFNYDNSQDISNSIVALTIATNIIPSGWTPEIIGVALKYGTRLYSSSLYQVRKSDPRLATTTRLNIDQMISSFVIGQTKFVIKVGLYEPEKFTLVEKEETKDEKNKEKVKEQKIGRSKTPTKEKEPEVVAVEVARPFPSLANVTKYLTEFFLENIFGVLLSKKYAVGVFKDNEQHFYMFDPHNTGPGGVRQERGVASLSRYSSLEDLSLIFLLSIGQLETGPNTFELYKVRYFIFVIPNRCLTLSIQNSD